jgi:hypothetical protein
MIGSTPLSGVLDRGGPELLLDESGLSTTGAVIVEPPRVGRAAAGRRASRAI